jgi:hypothetical protein
VLQVESVDSETAAVRRHLGAFDRIGVGSDERRQVFESVERPNTFREFGHAESMANEASSS